MDPNKGAKEPARTSDLLDQALDRDSMVVQKTVNPGWEALEQHHMVL